MQLTEHFKEEELGIVGESDRVRQNALFLLNEVLEPVRDKFGRVRVTSGLRSEHCNSTTGGVQDSQHLYQLDNAAVDFIPLEANIIQVFDWMRLSGQLTKIDQIILEHDKNTGKPSCIHVSTCRNRNPRNMALVGETHGTGAYKHVDFLNSSRSNAFNT